MIRIEDTLGGERVTFNYMNERNDILELRQFLGVHTSLGIDTESTGINCYAQGWELRSVQVGNADTAYMIPARRKFWIMGIMDHPMRWIGHNGPHDMRSIDAHLGYETGATCAGETFIPAHHQDSRNQKEGGVGHGLKDQAERYVARDAGKWEVELKKAFKNITIPIPGEVYKSGPRKGQQKVRKARLSEGWALIDPTHPAYIAYASADPIITFRLWQYYRSIVQQFRKLYKFDLRVQEACDRLQRRGIRLDEGYTRELDDAYITRADVLKYRAEKLGVENINSGAQIADTLLYLGAILTAKTPTGKFKTDDGILRKLKDQDRSSEASKLIRCIIGAKQMMKRRESYTASMLREMDSEGRIHPSIKPLGARTARMSVSGPPLQQLPTKNREDDE